jgi:drug/metabolite transporter (DMT)-like permease
MDKSVRYMLIAGASFAVMNVFVKLVSHLPTMEVVFFRAVFSFFASYLILKRLQIPVWGNNKKLLFYRGIAGCLGLIGSYYTLQNIPLASAVTLNYLSPLFTAVMGIFLVKQKLKPIQLLFFGIALTGVWLIKGFDARVSLSDVFIGLGAALFAGLAYNIIAILKTSEHPLVIILYFPMVTLPITGIYCLFHWEMPQGIDWLYLLFIGITTQIAQYYMTKSYQTANLAKVSILNYLGVIYALLAGYFFFNETYSLLSLIGIVVIIAAVLLNVFFSRNK